MANKPQSRKLQQQKTSQLQDQQQQQHQQHQQQQQQHSDQTFAQVLENSLAEPKQQQNTTGHTEAVRDSDSQQGKQLPKSQKARANNTPSQKHSPAQLHFSSLANANPLHLNTETFPSVVEVKKAAEKEIEEKAEHLKKKVDAAAPTHASVASQSALVKRVSEIPTVATACQIFNNSVDHVSKRSKLAKLAIDTSKKSISISVSLADKLSRPVKPMLGHMDAGAVTFLEGVQNRYPIMNKQPSEIAIRVRHSADTTAQKALSYRPVSYVVNFGARSLLSVNNVVLPRNTTGWTNVDKIGHGVLDYVKGANAVAVA